jgi:hypothetical protein
MSTTRMTCQHTGGCLVQPSFSYPDQNTSTYCAQHQLLEMVGKKKRNSGSGHCDCCECNKSLPLSDFSFSQRNRKRGERKCLNCVQVSRRRGGPSAESQHCCACERILPLSDFSFSQRKRKRDERKCLNCVQDSRPSRTESQHCCACERILPLSQFPSDREKKTPAMLKCLACSITQPQIEGGGGIQAMSHLLGTESDVTVAEDLYSVSSCPIVDARDGHEIYCHICGAPKFLRSLVTTLFFLKASLETLSFVTKKIAHFLSISTA